MTEPQEPIPVIKNFKWVEKPNNKRISTDFTYDSREFKLMLDMRKHTHYWKFEYRDIKFKRFNITRGRLERNSASIGKLAAMLGIPAISMIEMMSEFEEIQVLRSIAGLGENNERSQRNP